MVLDVVDVLRNQLLSMKEIKQYVPPIDVTTFGANHSGNKSVNGCHSVGLK
jgi:hypothetical protein